MPVRLAKLLLLFAGFSAFAAEPGAGPMAACPKGTTPVGTVTGRLGTFVVLSLLDGVAVRPGETLLAGRPALLIAVAKGPERVEAWGDWQEAGRVQIRAMRGPRAAIAFVTADGPRTGPRNEPVPSIRPGDILYRPAGAGSSP